jgi:hypothetical protein
MIGSRAQGRQRIIDDRGSAACVAALLDEPKHRRWRVGAHVIRRHLSVDRLSALATALLTFSLSTLALAASPSTTLPDPPSIEFGELCRAVEMTGLFPDQKTFLITHKPQPI